MQIYNCCWKCPQTSQILNPVMLWSYIIDNFLFHLSWKSQSNTMQNNNIERQIEIKALSLLKGKKQYGRRLTTRLMYKRRVYRFWDLVLITYFNLTQFIHLYMYIYLCFVQIKYIYVDTNKHLYSCVLLRSNQSKTCCKFSEIL